MIVKFLDADKYDAQYLEFDSIGKNNTMLIGVHEDVDCLGCVHISHEDIKQLSQFLINELAKIDTNGRE